MQVQLTAEDIIDIIHVITVEKVILTSLALVVVWVLSRMLKPKA